MRPALVEEGLEVLPIAATGRETLEAARAARPELVLLDIGLPDQSGLQVGMTIIQELPDTKVIALTALQDPKLAQEAIRVGFLGYVTKSADTRQFIQALRSVLAGNTVIPQRLAMSRSRSEHDVTIDQLTERELQVLRLLARGFPSAKIAAEMGIAWNTVRTHVQSILTKLQVHSRLEAAAFAVRHGLVEPRSHL